MKVPHPNTVRRCSRCGSPVHNVLTCMEEITEPVAFQVKEAAADGLQRCACGALLFDHELAEHQCIRSDVYAVAGARRPWPAY